jgi:MFS family permease
MFTPEEKRTLYGINFAVIARMLGLFLILPVLSPYTMGLEGSTPLLTGVALGVYGFTQAFLQIPFGYLSDRIGRKPVLTVGFLIYIFGSLMGAIAGNIWAMITARLLQGAGAISSAAVSLTADLIREEVRTRAFAQIGASVGITFAVSIAVAPIIAGKMGVPFIFILTAFLSSLALIYILFFIREPSVHKKEIQPSLKNISSILSDKNLLSLNFSVAVLHALLVTVFTVVPVELIDSFRMAKEEHWKVYVPVILLSIAVMVPSIIFAERKGKIREVYGFALLLITAGFLIPLFVNGFGGVLSMLVLYFIGFHLLEPTLPSLLTKLTHRDLRGLSVGVYNTSQFLGAFAGGILGGFALKKGLTAFHLTGFVLSALWLMITIPRLRNLKL